jgi:hypothetical protein
MNNGYVGWCWMLGPQSRRSYAWLNGATGASWAFIGASSSCAIAALSIIEASDQMTDES